MRLFVNGDPTVLDAGATITELLSAMGIAEDARGVAVARNGSVVLRADWPGIELAPGDRVEVLHAVQGG